jgi:hypothetical protein
VEEADPELRLVPNLGQVSLVASPSYRDRANAPHPWDLFAPRFGLAYRLTDKWVIRAGAGISFVPNNGNIGSGPGERQPAPEPHIEILVREIFQLHNLHW